MGHGTEHMSDSAYPLLEAILRDGGSESRVATLDGYLDLNRAMRLFKKAGISSLFVLPFMLVAGNHVKKDLAGIGKNSWETILLKNNFNIEIIKKPLGEYFEIQDIFIKHLKKIINTKVGVWL